MVFRTASLLRAVWAAFIFQFGCTAFAATYTVELREFGFNRADCAADISIVAEQFSAQSGATVLSSGCIPPDIGRIYATGSFTYAARSSVATTTSDVRGSTWSFDGYYFSVQECAQALEAEQEIFSRQTGLTPYVSYCYKANSVSAPRYRARIDAVGVSSIKKQSSSASWSARPENAQGLVQSVSAMVSEHGGEVVAAMVDRDISGYQVVVDYYGPEELYLQADENLYWQSAAECNAAATTFAQSWPSDAVASVFACSGGDRSAKQLLHVYLSTSVFSGFDFDLDVLSTAYASRATCEADSERIRRAVEDAGTTVLGLLCGQDASLRVWQLGLWTATTR